MRNFLKFSFTFVLISLHAFSMRAVCEALGKIKSRKKGEREDLERKYVEQKFFY